MAYDAGVKDIAELRQFGTKLNQAAEACTNLFQHLNAETHRICDSWNDDKASRFMQTFEERKREIDRLSQEMRKRVRDAAFFLIIMLVTFAATLLKPQKYVSSRTIQKCVEHVSTST